MSTEFSFRTRTQNIEILKRQPLDVLVIGGGVVGAGLIRDLALNGGLQAGLIEQGDFASGTSNATSELVHGGFRYLLQRDIALVKEARQERKILLRTAPNLVKPLPIAILTYKGEPYPLLGIHLAGLYYNHLAKTDRTEKSYAIRNPQAVRRLVGPIEVKGLKGGVIIWDSTVDDARLTLLTIKSAHEHGGVVANYVRFLDFLTNNAEGGKTVSGVLAEDVLSGEQFEIRAKKIVGATGPWIDKIWRQDPSYDGRPRLTTEKAKGSHLLIPRISASEYGILAFTHSERQHRGKPRVLFILPYAHNLSMIGTTESDPEEDLDRVRPSTSEIDYLIAEASRVFPHANIDRSNIISAYAGVRPLVAAEGNDFVSREHAIVQSPSGVMYIYGGKLTTYRRIGQEAADLITAGLNVPRNCRTGEHKLLDHDERVLEGCEGVLPAEARQRLIQRYGSGIAQIEALIGQDATLADRLIESLPFLKAEVIYACWEEMVLTLEDFLWRRTRIGLTRGQGIPQAPEIGGLIGQECGWDKERINAEVEQYTRRIRWLNAEI
ncbi:MAG: glycerol-3-phosphate dehydrogenase/oxidase [Candidatus Poribacteria bacterium]|nr:glycerol-3-phosphate dehydrogenase/oxidase [Candidatus Poribacteria bacterium]